MKRNLIETLNRWTKTDKFRVSLLETRFDATTWLLTIRHHGTIREYKLSDLELEVAYGKIYWRVLLAQIIRDLRNDSFKNRD